MTNDLGPVGARHRGTSSPAEVQLQGDAITGQLSGGGLRFASLLGSEDEIGQSGSGDTAFPRGEEAVRDAGPGRGDGSHAESASAVGGPLRPTDPSGRAWLETQLGDSKIAEAFIRDYLAMLQSRVQAIRDELAAGDLDGAYITLLSLEASSAMVGAEDVVEAAHKMRLAGQRGGVVVCQQLLAELNRQAELAPRRISHSDGTDPKPDGTVQRPEA